MVQFVSWSPQNWEIRKQSFESNAQAFEYLRVAQFTYGCSGDFPSKITAIAIRIPDYPQLTRPGITQPHNLHPLET